MNIKKLQISSIENVKKKAPSIYKNTLELSIPFYMLHKILFENGNKMLSEKFSLSQTELDVLATLLFSDTNNDIMTPTELYDIMLFSSGGMTKVLKKLESKNYILRIDNGEDKRSKLVQITDLGKEIVTKALKEIVEFDDSYFSKLDKNEQQILKQLLYKILDIN